uniref:Uncharacterized protein n=1 Tax=viral metagenome TaxID=1070528 RepID=A0A6M3LXI0_9ZZZZ
MGAQVIKLFPTDLDDFLDFIGTAYREGRLKEFICICNTEYPKGRPHKLKSEIPKYWFGTNCLKALGLLEVMKDEIFAYLHENQEE